MFLPILIVPIRNNLTAPLIPLCRFFARYKFVTYLLTYLLTYIKHKNDNFTQIAPVLAAACTVANRRTNNGSHFTDNITYLSNRILQFHSLVNSHFIYFAIVIYTCDKPTYLFYSMSYSFNERTTVICVIHV